MLLAIAAILAAIILIASKTGHSIRQIRSHTLKTLGALNLSGSKVRLSPEQKDLFNKFEATSNNMFITGKAGTGKSVLLQYMKQNTRKRVAILAPTGLAALNVGAQTINSLFKLPLKYIPLGSLKLDPAVAEVLMHIDAIIIDEASMVRADVLDAIDSLLSQARKNQYPFGGAQIVLFGDVYQLPPVVDNSDQRMFFTDRTGGYYFFDAQVWAKASFRTYELNGVFRQKDEEFISLLNAVRTGDITPGLLAKLNTRVTKNVPRENILTLATTNNVVSGINSKHLQSLRSKEYSFKASIIGSMATAVQPTETILRLKKGAQVMLIKNDKAKRWANGSIGRIYSCDSDIVRVELNGRLYTVAPETWKTIEYAYDSIADAVIELTTSSFTQLPIKLAWAVTIHKAQGQTLDDVIIDFAQGTFAHGQAYVALSRCVSFARLYLTRPINAADIIVDRRVAAFMEKSSPTTK